MSLAPSLRTIEELIRSGKGKEAQEKLLAFSLSQIRRSDIAYFARLARRAGLVELGLRLLQPIVRPTVGQASPEELAEYANCLTRVGAAEEALTILETLDPRLNPHVWLCRASAFIHRWNYRKAIPLLFSYLDSPVPHYQKLVAKLNLAAACVIERHHLQATHLLRELLHDSSAGRYALLLGNALELSAQNCILQRK